MAKIYVTELWGSPILFCATKRAADVALSEALIQNSAAKGSVRPISYTPTRDGIAALLNSYGERQ